MFNISTIGALKIQVSPQDLSYILNVDTTFNQTYIKAIVTYFYRKINFNSFRYQNGEIVKTIDGAGLKLKGFYTRTLQKKGWNLKFNAFSKDKLFGLKKAGLKGIDTSFAKNLLINDYLRSMNVPGSRSGYLSLFTPSLTFSASFVFGSTL